MNEERTGLSEAERYEFEMQFARVQIGTIEAFDGYLRAVEILKPVFEELKKSKMQIILLNGVIEEMQKIQDAPDAAE